MQVNDSVGFKEKKKKELVMAVSCRVKNIEVKIDSFGLKFETLMVLVYIAFRPRWLFNA